MSRNSKKAGADEIMCMIQMGTIPQEAMMETIRQFGEYVIPHFRGEGEGGMSNNWGRFGADDERGMLNLLTPDVVLASMGVPTTGKVYSLALPIQRDGVPYFDYRGAPDASAARSSERPRAIHSLWRARTPRRQRRRTHPRVAQRDTHRCAEPCVQRTKDVQRHPRRGCQRLGWIDQARHRKDSMDCRPGHHARLRALPRC